MVRSWKAGPWSLTSDEFFEIEFRGKEVLDGRLPACPHFSLNTKGASSRKIEWELSFFPIHSNATFSYYLAGGSSGEWKPMPRRTKSNILSFSRLLPFLSSFCVNFVNSLYWTFTPTMAKNRLNEKFINEKRRNLLFFRVQILESTVKPTEKQAQNERAEQASRWAGERWDERAWRLDESKKKKKSLIIDSDYELRGAQIDFSVQARRRNRGLHSNEIFEDEKGNNRP